MCPKSVVLGVVESGEIECSVIHDLPPSGKVACMIKYTDDSIIYGGLMIKDPRLETQIIRVQKKSTAPRLEEDFSNLCQL